MPKVTIYMTGDAKLTKMLNALGSKKARAIYVKGLRKGAKVVADWARHIAPRRTGTYAKSITVRAGRRSRTGPSIRVTQREGNYKGKAFYGSFLEFGWRVGKRKRKAAVRLGMLVDNRRKIKGRWILKKAGDFKEPEAIGLFTAEVRRLVEQEAK